MPDAYGDDAIQQTPKTRRSRRHSSVDKFTAILGPGRSITVKASDLTMELLVQLLEELSGKAKRAKVQHLQIRTFEQVLRDTCGFIETT